MRYHNLGGYFKHLLVLALLCALLAGCSNAQQQTEIDNTSYSGAAEASQTDIGDAQQQAAGDTPYGIPVYTGRPYVELNGNIPEFTDAEKIQMYLRHIVNLTHWEDVRLLMLMYVRRLCLLKNVDR